LSKGNQVNIPESGFKTMMKKFLIINHWGIKKTIKKLEELRIGDFSSIFKLSLEIDNC